MPIFAVIRRRTERWDRQRPLEEQQGWRPHADFMNKLEDDGFALLAGPLEDGRDDVLLILRADSAERIDERLAGDPWTETGLLETVRVAPWSLRLGALD